MDAERLLILYGWPVNDALSMCYSLRKEGTLSEFLERERVNYLKRLGRYGAKETEQEECRVS